MKRLMTFTIGLLISSTAYARCGWPPYCGDDAEPQCVQGNTWQCVPKAGQTGSSNSPAEMESRFAFVAGTLTEVISANCNAVPIAHTYNADSRGNWNCAYEGAAFTQTNDNWAAFNVITTVCRNEKSTAPQGNFEIQCKLLPNK